MQVRVKLSSDPLIDYWDFCRSIAEALCPTGEEGVEGIECVIGKVVSNHVPIPESHSLPVSSPFYHTWQSVLVSEDGRTLNQLLPSDQAVIHDDRELELPFAATSPRQIGEISLRFPLSDDDRRDLAEVLPNLPPLRYPMSEQETAAFMEAYFNMPNHPMWVPELVTEATIERRKAHQDAEFRRRQEALRQEFEAGRLTPVNASHMPVAALMVGTFIPRTQAIAYLKKHGLAYEDEMAGTTVLEPVRASKSALERPNIPEVSSSPNSGNKVGAPKASPSERAAAVKYYYDLRADGVVNFLEQTAKKYGVSPRTITEWVNKANEDKKKQSPNSIFRTR